MENQRHILSILVENQPGVLSRVTGLISRRGFNIESLSVGPTEDVTLARLTIVMMANDVAYEQITKQLHKLISVHKITDLRVKMRLSVNWYFLRFTPIRNAVVRLLKLRMCSAPTLLMWANRRLLLRLRVLNPRLRVLKICFVPMALRKLFAPV